MLSLVRLARQHTKDSINFIVSNSHITLPFLFIWNWKDKSLDKYSVGDRHAHVWILLDVWWVVGPVYIPSILSTLAEYILNWFSDVRGRVLREERGPWRPSIRLEYFYKFEPAHREETEKVLGMRKPCDHCGRFDCMKERQGRRWNSHYTAKLRWIIALKPWKTV